jgi:hypothetical protein
MRRDSDYEACRCGCRIQHGHSWTNRIELPNVAAAVDIQALPDAVFTMIWPEVALFGLTAACSLPVAILASMRPRLLASLANLSLAFPLIAVSLLYAEWFLAWLMLGHKPIWSTNDPKFISGSSWMHTIVAIALLGYFPIGISALIFNLSNLFRVRPSAAQAGIRLQTLVAVWLGVYCFFTWDPHGVLSWWWD